ncbi:MAG: hypothetical protein K6B73_02940 [Treponema sp.]|nr:hypothetical protein [Treponema sp.]
MHDYFEERLYSELEAESFFLEEYVLNSRLDYLSSLNTKNRITLIHSDGSVYFDNTVKTEKLENHGRRSEFIQASMNGSSRISRFSSTMTEKTLYYARLLPNSDIMRISCDQRSVWVMILGMSQLLLFMLVLAVIVSGIAASFLSKKLVEPLNKIDFDNPLATEVYEELEPFTRRIAEENFEKAQREELRQQFSANVSHELKTPLTSISGFAEILRAGGTDEKTTRDFATTIYTESQRMISLVNDIIKLSKLDEKSISLEKEELSLREICREAMECLAPQASQKKISVNLSGDSGSIKGVRPVIYEMIYNLIDNAIKYNREEGSVDINIRNMLSDNPDIKGRVILSVKDSGIGIAPEEKERIFERFYRVDKSRSKQNGGTGLGLSIVKHAAKYHDASILLNSQPGKGSTFKIVFQE